MHISNQGGISLDLFIGYDLLDLVGTSWRGYLVVTYNVNISSQRGSTYNLFDGYEIVRKCGRLR